jgi:anthraniloyl-CoA monooxygenase
MQTCDAADGINSAIRRRHADHFQPDIDLRACKYIGPGTYRPFDAFTFYFVVRERMYQATVIHSRRGSTFIVETEDVWMPTARTGERRGDDRVRQKLFAKHLDGYGLCPIPSTCADRRGSIFRASIRRWHCGNLVFRDAAHAHFGGSHRLAMESAVSSPTISWRHAPDDRLARYEDEPSSRC